MGIVVRKHGGTSVASAERIRNVARRIVATAERGHPVVVVVSAMGHTTDQLMEQALEISPVPHARELDMLLSAGERISMSLLSMAIIEMGREAVSLTGSQAGIVTDTTHTKARIVDVRARRILEALDAGKIVIVAGFQGVSTISQDVTTLGRGGSDTTAVALAAALHAKVFGSLAAESINVDMIVQNVSEDGRTDQTFTLPKDDLPRSEEALGRIAAEIGAEGWTAEPEVGKLSLVGAGMRSHPGVAAKMVQALSEAGINIEMISTSSIRISVVLQASEVDRAVRLIHAAFELPEGAILREHHGGVPEMALTELNEP